MLASEFTMLGDAVWLDFVNTARGRVESPPDLIPDIAALARWANAQSIWWVDREGPPFEDVMAFRQCLTTLAEALHAGLQPPAGCITAINQHLSRNAGYHQLTRVSGQWQLRFAPAGQPGLLPAIAGSAAAGLATPLLVVRRCAGAGCSLFFSDDSPNGARRWCTASICGRQMKVERRRGLLR